MTFLILLDGGVTIIYNTIAKIKQLLLPFTRFYLKLMKATENEIQFDYFKALFKGEGIWLLNEVNHDQTLVTYTISIIGNSFLSDWFLKSLIFRWKHTQDILSLIDKLNYI
jgi:hypothetical protein